MPLSSILVMPSMSIVFVSREVGGTGNPVSVTIPLRVAFVAALGRWGRIVGVAEMIVVPSAGTVVVTMPVGIPAPTIISGRHKTNAQRSIAARITKAGRNVSAAGGIASRIPVDAAVISAGRKKRPRQQGRGEHQDSFHGFCDVALCGIIQSGFYFSTAP